MKSHKHVWEIDLSGSTALVTGASRGIGKAIAVALAQAGADIVGAARSEDALTDTCDEVMEAGSDCLKVVADLAKPEAIQELADRSWQWRDGVDILVNAAGTIIRSEMPNMSPEDFDQVVGVNLRAPFLLSQNIGWRMREHGGGSIVNVTSVAGEEVTGAPLDYQASKAGLIHLTRGLASRLAPKVRVNAVGPGYIRTSLNEKWLGDPSNEQYVLDQTASGSVGIPDDVCGAVVFLASPGASYINGQHLRIDGGWGL